jgi:hypothetical protein
MESSSGGEVPALWKEYPPRRQPDQHGLIRVLPVSIEDPGSLQRSSHWCGPSVRWLITAVGRSDPGRLFTMLRVEHRADIYRRVETLFMLQTRSSGIDSHTVNGPSAAELPQRTPPNR